MASAPRTWLVATDFSPAAKAALALAWRDLAAMGGGRILACHVSGILEAVGEKSARTPSEEHADIVDAVQRKMPPEVASGNITVEFCSRRGIPADGILAEAAVSGAERIVMGSHGRVGVDHFLMGSVAATVIRRAPMPVVVVKF